MSQYALHEAVTVEELRSSWMGKERVEERVDQLNEEGAMCPGRLPLCHTSLLRQSWFCAF